MLNVEFVCGGRAALSLRKKKRKRRGGKATSTTHFTSFSFSNALDGVVAFFSLAKSFCSEL